MSNLLVGASIMASVTLITNINPNMLGWIAIGLVSLSLLFKQKKK